MISALRNFCTFTVAILLASVSLTAQNEGYQKAGNDSRPASGQRDSYATPGDQPIQSRAPQNEEADALRGGNFVVGTGFGYINTISTIEIDNGNNIQKGGNKGFQLHLTPTIGYFISRNFVFGLGMDYLVSSAEDRTTNNARTSDTKLLFGPYARIYFPFAGDQALFLGGAYGYGKSDTEISDGTQTQTAKTSLMTFGIGPGYTIFSNGRVSLETQARYNYGISRNLIQVDNANQRTRTLTTAWDFLIGMHFYFTRNRQ